MSPMNPLRKLLPAALCTALALPAAQALAAGGAFDTSFSGDGIVSGLVAGYTGEWRAILPLPDGRLLTVGSGFYNGSIPTWTVTGMAAIYLEDGTLDPTFANGTYIQSLPGTQSTRFWDAIRQADGKFVLVGLGTPPSGGPDGLFVVRLNPDGSKDTSFGDQGQRYYPTVHPSFGARRVLPYGDGQLLVVGIGTMVNVLDHYGVAEVLRLNADGSLDTSFDGDGQRVLLFSGNDFVSQVSVGVAVQPDGRVLVAANEGGGGGDMAVYRLNADGSNDTSFDEKVPGAPNRDGQAIYSLGNSQEQVFDLLLQPDGKVVLGGQQRPTAADTFRLFLFRAMPNGTWDPDYVGGTLTDVQGYTGERLERIFLQPDGGYLGIGSAKVNTTYPEYHQQLLARYRADGSLDTGFGNGGTIVNAIQNCTQVYGGALDGEGRIYTVGTSSNNGYAAGGNCNSSDNFLITRHEAVPMTDTTPPAVAGKTPAGGATGVPLQSTVSVTFSEAILPASLGTAPITLTCGGVAITGTSAYAATPTPTLTFTPASALPSDKGCTARLAAGYKDLAGNRAGSRTSWSFRTQRVTKRLTVARGGTGSGRVLGAPVLPPPNGVYGIDCGTRCSTKVVVDRGYQLRARPATGDRFVGWQGCPQANGSLCEVPSMRFNRTVTALFEPIVP